MDRVVAEPVTTIVRRSGQRITQRRDAVAPHRIVLGQIGGNEPVECGEVAPDQNHIDILGDDGTIRFGLIEVLDLGVPVCTRGDVSDGRLKSSANPTLPSLVIGLCCT